MTDEIRIRWRIPVITLILAATAIPVELRPPGSESLDFGVEALDVIENIAGYLPVGIVLAEFGFARAVLAAALLSACAESSQFVMMHRTPSAVDLVTNTLGAALGAIIGGHWRIVAPALRINRDRAQAAALLVPLILVGMWARSAPIPNGRGLTAPGELEARWRFDESGGRQIVDSSRHGLDGWPHGQPMRVTGPQGGALLFDGDRDYVDFGRPSELRLEGSMTLCAWIKPSWFPVDDAAIVSSLKDYGFQLDTTIDSGPRTIGFKLTDACGGLMARYGATPIAAGTWCHVAGVYNAEAKTLDVYLNGERDNGVLRGTVTGQQRSSSYVVYVGSRSRFPAFEFAGSIGDVRIYSVALSKAQVAAAMHGEDVDVSQSVQAARGTVEGSSETAQRPGFSGDCIIYSEPEDATIPAASCVLGVLVAVAFAGRRRSPQSLPCMLASVAAGLLLLKTTTSTLPSFNLWLVPLTSVMGCISVAASASLRPAKGAGQ